MYLKVMAICYHVTYFSVGAILFHDISCCDYYCMLLTDAMHLMKKADTYESSCLSK